jgi:hypothetical protein
MVIILFIGFIAIVCIMLIMVIMVTLVTMVIMAIILTHPARFKPRTYRVGAGNFPCNQK